MNEFKDDVYDYLTDLIYRFERAVDKETIKVESYVLTPHANGITFYIEGEKKTYKLVVEGE
jgi:hypothetical protein